MAILILGKVKFKAESIKTMQGELILKNYNLYNLINTKKINK
jgi:hypothetical protein